MTAIAFPDIAGAGAPPKLLNTAENLGVLLHYYGVSARLGRAGEIVLNFGDPASAFLDSAPWAAQWGFIKSAAERHALPAPDVDYLFLLAAKPRPTVILGMEAVQ